MAFEFRTAVKFASNRLQNDESIISATKRLYAIQGWNRKKIFLLMVEAFLIVTAVPEDSLLLKRRHDAERIQQLLLFLEHTKVFHFFMTPQVDEEERLLIRPFINEIFGNYGIIRNIADFL